MASPLRSTGGTVRLRDALPAPSAIPREVTIVGNHRTIIYPSDASFDPGETVVAQVRAALADDISSKFGFPTGCESSIEYANGDELCLWGLGIEPVFTRFAITVKGGRRDVGRYIDTGAYENSPGWRLVEELLGIPLTQVVYKI